MGFLLGREALATVTIKSAYVEENAANKCNKDSVKAEIKNKKATIQNEQQ